MSKRHHDTAEAIATEADAGQTTEFPAAEAASGDVPVEHAEPRQVRQYTAREAFAKIQSILKRCEPEVRAKVLATANAVVELG